MKGWSWCSLGRSVRRPSLEFLWGSTAWQRLKNSALADALLNPDKSKIGSESVNFSSNIDTRQYMDPKIVADLHQSVDGSVVHILSESAPLLCWMVETLLNYLYLNMHVANHVVEISPSFCCWNFSESLIGSPVEFQRKKQTMAEPDYCFICSLHAAVHVVSLVRLVSPENT